MKKTLLILFVAGISLFILNSSAFAAAKWDFKTTEKGSSDLKTEFGWDEKPFSFLFIDQDKFSPVPSELDIKLTWLYGAEEQYSERFYHLSWSNNLGPKGNFRIWEDPDRWNDIRQVGDWIAKVSWSANVDDTWTSNFNKSANFTVTPEPLSGILFAVGGVALAFFRKKKSKV
ncbi:MAG: PEP-CTERM sorting domain-containing protein [Candidatus Omnitrophota bacterium]|nr:PEP-CTERM sorting domain-containing protein [Candidatus Omnitrophota bacterium]